MKNTGRSWVPTVTLAKLFEEQNQFFDAIAAYELISQNDASPAVRERIEALHIRILNDPSNRYDPRIEKLFTPEELAYLKILNHNGFENMAQAAQKISEGALDADIFFDDDEDFGFEEPEQRDLLTQMLMEIEQQAQMNILDTATEYSEYTVRDLMIALLGKFDPKQKLNDIKFSELISIFVEMQSFKPRD
ncbi:MAG: hypothetical protein Q8M98_03260 [Candidatus Cloacimonadaceae bacterium]|nr:hypothetical protein [Candidatus Cloacimonadaceae bacterium]